MPGPGVGTQGNDQTHWVKAMKKATGRIKQGLLRFWRSRFISSMRTKLTFSYLLLTMLPLLFISWYVYSIASDTLKDEVSSYILNTIGQVNVNIDNTFVQLSKKAMRIGSDETLKYIIEKDMDRPVEEKLQDDDTVSDIISEVMQDFPGIEAAYIYSYSGDTYGMKGVESSMDSDFFLTSASWFKSMNSLQKKSMILPTYLPADVLSGTGERYVFSYITRITDIATNKNIGYIKFDLDTSLFEELFESLEGNIIVIDNNKRIIYDTDPAYISTQLRTDYLGELLEMQDGRMQSGDQLVFFDTSAMTGWTVIIEMPANAIFAKIYAFEYTLIYTLLLCVFFALVVSVLMSRSLTEPINALRSQMKEVESGRFDIAVSVKSNDEIGELSKSFSSMLGRIKELIQSVYQTEIYRKEATISALQAQINPHFLYNTLQIIDIMAEDKGADEISSACQALAKIFRYSISKGKDIVTVREEIEHVRNYVYIQKLRLGDKLLEVEYNIPDEVMELEILKLVIQPLVENSVVHGIEATSRKSLIRISAAVDIDDLIITIEDTGVGMDEEELRKVQRGLYDTPQGGEVKSSTGGIALQNVHSRIKLYYSERYGMSIHSRKNKGTKVTLVFPVSRHKSEKGGYLNA